MSAPARGARARFSAAVSVADERIDLAEAALLIAAQEYPQLALEPYLRRLDVLAERVNDRLSNETAPPIVLQELTRVLFEEEGLRGNEAAYYDPRNSFLNDVLDRKLGIPISLGVVVLEVGRRLGLPLEGLGFPGHFLVRYRGEAMSLLIDPFDGGRIRFEDQAQELLDRVYGGMVRLKPEFTRPIGRRDIIERMLRNLKGIYLNAKDDHRALGVIELLLVLKPEARQEIRDRGILLARIGRYDEAIEQLELYLVRAPGATDASRVREYILRLSEAADR
ncbi:MAG TPA: transglutaminase-like domain-containing protein [Longimicrobiales bacterium]|nr:transglutaminase-like domain-containing protein [Longimicrobiales bacterium]